VSFDDDPWPVEWGFELGDSVQESSVDNGRPQQDRPKSSTESDAWCPPCHEIPALPHYCPVRAKEVPK
jgi:hypothetical protein